MTFHITLHQVRVGLISLLAFALVTLVSVEAGAKNGRTAALSTAPFSVELGTYVEIGTNNLCSGDATIQLSFFGGQDLGGVIVIGGKPLASLEASLFPGEGVFLRHFGPDGAKERTKIMARLRIQCSRGRSDKAIQGPREAGRFSVEIIDAKTESTIRAEMLNFNLGVLVPT